LLIRKQLVDRSALLEALPRQTPTASESMLSSSSRGRSRTVLVPVLAEQLGLPLADLRKNDQPRVVSLNPWATCQDYGVDGDEGHLRANQRN
jgi:hypothetical protein